MFTYPEIFLRLQLKNPPPSSSREQTVLLPHSLQHSSFTPLRHEELTGFQSFTPLRNEVFFYFSQNRHFPNMITVKYMFFRNHHAAVLCHLVSHHPEYVSQILGRLRLHDQEGRDGELQLRNQEGGGGENRRKWRGRKWKYPR